MQVEMTEPKPEPSEQLRTITEAKRAPLQQGQEVVIVDRQWYRRFEAACSGGGDDKELADLTMDDVGPLSNGQLEQLEMMQEGVNCEFVPLEAWRKLEAWYGANDQPIVRKVILRGEQKTPSIELYPPIISVGRVRSTGAPATTDWIEELKLSAVDTIADLRKAIEAKMSIERPYRIWAADREVSEDRSRFVQPATDELVSVPADRVRDLKYGISVLDNRTKDTQDTLADLDLGQRHIHLLVEELTADTHWPVSNMAAEPAAPVSPPKLGGSGGFFNQMPASKPPKRAALNSLSTTVPTTSAPVASTSRTVTTRSQAPPVSNRTRGLVGLQNLGNTCVSQPITM